MQQEMHQLMTFATAVAPREQTALDSLECHATFASSKGQKTCITRKK